MDWIKGKAAQKDYITYKHGSVPREDRAAEAAMARIPWEIPAKLPLTLALINWQDIATHGT